jgi:hypothetical protein
VVKTARVALEKFSQFLSKISGFSCQLERYSAALPKKWICIRITRHINVVDFWKNDLLLIKLTA